MNMGERNLRANPIKVFIAVGHGGPDPGAVANGIAEADCNLTVALAMDYELRRHGFQVKLSRYLDEEDRLREEITECNLYQPDLAVAIHTNAGGGSGFEVYYQLKNWETAKESKLLAEAFHNRVKAFFPGGSRGVKIRTDLGWLNQVQVPAILCENFFVDGPKAAWYAQLEQLKTIGKVYTMAILNVYGVAYCACEEQVLRYTLILADDTSLNRTSKAYLLHGNHYVNLWQFAAQLGWGVFYERNSGQVVVYPAEYYQPDEFAKGIVRIDTFQSREEKLLTGVADAKMGTEAPW